jgi:hypothetical protein
VRDKLPDRRPSLTTKVFVEIDGHKYKILLTIGFRDEAMTKPAEVFSSSFKVGTQLNAIVSDSCVLLSRLYQHGDDPKEIAEGLSEPRSLVGEIALAVSKVIEQTYDSHSSGYSRPSKKEEV